MPEQSVIVWDLETIPDLEAAARMLDMGHASDAEVREALGPGFPKHPLHKIACIGALIASRQPEGWRVDALGAPHIGERSEAKLISDFIDKIGQLKPQLITFNGHSFDLPVLRYRAMVNRISASGLQVRQYFHRYTEDALDLCDVLGSYVPGGKVKLDEVSKILGLTGKPEGIDGSRVEEMVLAGQIEEVARAMCSTPTASGSSTSCSAARSPPRSSSGVRCKSAISSWPARRPILTCMRRRGLPRPAKNSRKTIPQHQNCQAISIMRRRKRSNRCRVMQAAERPLSRAADPSMYWTGIGAAVFDRRGGSHGLGGRTASGWRRSMSRRNGIA